MISLLAWCEAASLRGPCMRGSKSANWRACALDHWFLAITGHGLCECFGRNWGVNFDCWPVLVIRPGLCDHGGPCSWHSKDSGLSRRSQGLTLGTSKQRCVCVVLTRLWGCSFRCRGSFLVGTRPDSNRDSLDNPFGLDKGRRNERKEKEERWCQIDRLCEHRTKWLWYFGIKDW